MTNEQLAVFIKQGDSNELVPILWERVRRFMHMLSDRYFRAYSEKLAAYGIAPEDLKAAAYPAFLKAIETFDENKGYKFISCLRYPLKNEYRKIWTKDLLNKAESLNAPLKGSDEGEETEWIDLVADDTSLDFTERVERESLCAAVRSAVEKLPPEQQDYIRRRFYNGNTLKEIAQSEGKSTALIQQREQRLLKELRQNKDFLRLRDELGYSSRQIYHDTLSGFKNRGISNVEAVASYRADILLQVRTAVSAYDNLPPQIKEKLVELEASKERLLATLRH